MFANYLNNNEEELKEKVEIEYREKMDKMEEARKQMEEFQELQKQKEEVAFISSNGINQNDYENKVEKTIPLIENALPKPKKEEKKLKCSCNYNKK